MTEDNKAWLTRVAELEAALREASSAMEIQEKRQTAEFHLSVEAFAPIWRSAIDRARSVLSGNEKLKMDEQIEKPATQQLAALWSLLLSEHAEAEALRASLREIANQDAVENMIDPQWAVLTARAALAGEATGVKPACGECATWRKQAAADKEWRLEVARGRSIIKAKVRPK